MHFGLTLKHSSRCIKYSRKKTPKSKIEVEHQNRQTNKQANKQSHGLKDCGNRPRSVCNQSSMSAAKITIMNTSAVACKCIQIKRPDY